MKETIITELQHIEAREDVKILYAVESGSRAWGFPSKDSDYDVRFIYVHQKDWYLTIEDKRDVLEYPISNDLDISGWDLRKALQLYRKSNPSLLEWLKSPVIYRDNPQLKEKLSTISRQYVSEKKLLYHYLHMAKGNFRGYLQGDKVKIKKYFYVLRPIFACEWLMQHHETPPILFDDLLKLDNIPTDVQRSVDDLLEKKKDSKELDLEPKLIHVNQYIEDEIGLIEAYIGKITDVPDVPFEPLNQLFQLYLR